VIVCDTGPLVAAALANDDDHHACVELFTGLHLARRELLVPGPVVAEVGYLLNREAGVDLGRRLRNVPA
jgi:predicted nucleic acid-binding protein